MMNTEKLNLTPQWDKTFEKSDKVLHRKVTFINRFGITLAADMYEPKDAEGKLPALAVSGPFGAVKEQCSGLYAQTMAERGFLTIAFDPSYTGESGGEPRYMASPDINTEDFMAAVDFLSLNEKVDSEHIGIIGICDWGGMALQRLEDLKNGSYKRAGGCLPLPVPEDVPFFVKDYSEYYKGRAYHERSLNSNEGWNVIGCESFMNQPILKYSNEIRSAVLIIHGEKAHSCYFSKDAYANMIKDSKYTDNKELMIIPDAVHTDLYDNLDVIPFNHIEEFVRKYV
ncbi:alpha/beta hydrolase [Butyrivibrio sp. WCD2001]|uniref:alpha/beta hydrolase n=1 Tax=Butyrivibrio sp. WCD2001 TaxID=1280681 RepID=UPI000479AAF7|nr:alpha/beta hydrolase [Butyrivibrio sp. WCD2001]